VYSKPELFRFRLTCANTLYRALIKQKTNEPQSNIYRSAYLYLRAFRQPSQNSGGWLELWANEQQHSCIEVLVAISLFHVYVPCSTSSLRHLSFTTKKHQSSIKLHINSLSIGIVHETSLVEHKIGHHIVGLASAVRFIFHNI